MNKDLSKDLNIQTGFEIVEVNEDVRKKLRISFTFLAFEENV